MLSGDLSSSQILLSASFCLTFFVFPLCFFCSRLAHRARSPEVFSPHDATSHPSGSGRQRKVLVSPSAWQFSSLRICLSLWVNQLAQLCFGNVLLFWSLVVVVLWRDFRILTAPDISICGLRAIFRIHIGLSLPIFSCFLSLQRLTASVPLSLPANHRVVTPEATGQQGGSASEQPKEWSQPFAKVWYATKAVHW